MMQELRTFAWSRTIAAAIVAYLIVMPFDPSETHGWSGRAAGLVFVIWGGIEWLRSSMRDRKHEKERQEAIAKGTEPIAAFNRKHYGVEPID